MRRARARAPCRPRVDDGKGPATFARRLPPRAFIERLGKACEVGARGRSGSQDVFGLLKKGGELVGDHTACGWRGGWRRGGEGTVVLQLDGHGLGDGIDEDVELLLRHAGRQGRRRLSVARDETANEEDHRQRDDAQRSHSIIHFTALEPRIASDRVLIPLDLSQALRFSGRSPAECTPAALPWTNWLPAPKGDFIAMMRMYGPKETDPSILNGTWKPPAIIRL